MSSIAKNKGKKFQNKAEVNKMNRTALLIGGIAAGGILLLMVVSFLT